MKDIKVAAWLVVFGVVLGSPIVGLTVLPERAIAQELDDEINQAIARGNRFYQKGNIESLQRAIIEFEIVIRKSQAVDDTWAEGFAWNALGRAYERLGDTRKALDCYLTALPLRQTYSSVAATRTNIGAIYVLLGEHYRAIAFYNDALSLVKPEKDYDLESNILNHLGLAYESLGEHHKALEYYDAALKLIVIMRHISHKNDQDNILRQAAIFSNIGLIHLKLGEYQTTIQYLTKALQLNDLTKDYYNRATILNVLGNVYYEIGEYQEAFKNYEQALSLRQSVGNRRGEGITLNSIGNLYSKLGDNQKAVEYYSRALSLRYEIGDRRGEAVTLASLGTIYTLSGERQKAIEYYHQALPIVLAVNDLAGEARVLNGMATALANQGEIDSSIIFFKQSVNIYEVLRGFIKKFSQEQQISYIETIAYTYRNLAKLLIQQNRVMEAIQVLDLLKAQELRQYLPDHSPNSAPPPGIDLLPQEQTFWDRYTAIMQPAIDQSTEFNDLARLTQPTPQQTQRLNELKRIQDQIPEQLDQYRNSPEANQLFNQLKNTAAQQNLSLPIYQTFQTKVNALSQNAALFYPLVLDDRLELVILIPGKAPIRRTVNVTKAELENNIKIFRQQIGDAHTNGIPKYNINTVKQSANKLYNWLLKDIDPELQSANIQTILYAPDGQLRYIPLAALYDAKQWLTQKYQINHLTALALTPIEPASSQPPRTLAAAFTGLKHSRGEIEILSQILKIKPDDILFDRDFSKAAIVSRLPKYEILHLATHGIFVPDKPEESYILMGNGEKLRLTDIKGWNFPNLQFVMLSACETGQGDQLSNGIEVLGFGYQLQQAKVRASMTSLWKVHDAGTRLLSQQFYAQAYGNNLRKTAALQKVQQDFIAGNMNVEMAKLRGACFG